MKHLWILLLILGCTTTPPLDREFSAASGAYADAKAAYLDALIKDNAQVRECYATHPSLTGSAAESACPPKIAQGTRNSALRLIKIADATVLSMSKEIAVGGSPDVSDTKELTDTATTLAAMTPTFSLMGVH